MVEISPARHSLATYLVPLRRRWGWLLAAGIALVALGIFGLAATFLFSLASAIAYGALMTGGGIVMLADAFQNRGWQSRLFMVLIGVLYLATGFFIFYDPVAAVVTLTVLVGAALVGAGILRIVVAFQVRPLPIWTSIVLSGLVSLLLGALVLAQWPGSSQWLLGTFLAIELICQGWVYIAISLAIRSTFDGVRKR